MKLIQNWLPHCW